MPIDLNSVSPRAGWTRECVASHLGVWCMEPSRLRTLAALACAGRLPVRAAWDDEPETTADRETRLLREIYRVGADGLATLLLEGPMQKFDSKYGGVNTLRARKAARLAAADEKVRGVLLVIDSPGGSADGTLELAQDLAALSRAKPTAAHVRGMMASAALWAGVQARRVTAGPADLVGSIGTYGQVWDTTGQAEQEGIRVEVIAAGGDADGGVKGQGVWGTAPTDAYRAEVKKIVTGLNELFLAGVASGRRMPLGRVRELADGRVHLGHEAVRLGLIDAVTTLDQAAEDLLGQAAAVGGRSGGRTTATARARLELDQSR